MDINFFGLIAVTKRAMLVLRETTTDVFIQQLDLIGAQRFRPPCSQSVRHLFPQ